MDVSLEAQTRPLATLSAFSYIPPRRKDPKEMTYFRRESQVPEVSMYDRVFSHEEGYDMKLQREDRRHYKGRGLNIHAEEKARVVPVLSSSNYGCRSLPVPDQPDRQFARVARVQTEFFSKNGIIWSLAESYGSVAPM